MEAAPLPSMPLPDAFIDFLNQNGLDPSIYDSTTIQSTPRYIRLKPSDGGEYQIDDIETEISCKLEKVNWLPGFFSIPPHIQIASTNAYREAKIYGMDAASGAAVSALNVSPGDHVLDLCAAPGAKLCMISELLGSCGSVTGVDVAKHRLAACRTMLQKYALGDRCRLFVADGKILLEETRDVFKEWSSKRSFKERKKASKERNDIGSHLVPRAQEPELIFYGRNSGVVGVGKRELFEAVFGNESSIPGYDKVLVDAECTHDGSIKHIQKFEHWGWKTLERRVLDAQRTDTLTHLQFHAQHPDVTVEWPKLQLLTNGFRLLKVGGSLVYSTCSLTVAQNEDVVEQFLSGNPFAELQEIGAANNWPCKSGRIPKTLRFDPMTSQTSGLFVAKFAKLAA